MALLTLVVLLLFTGRLRPERLVSEMREDRDARLSELRAQVEEWKAAHKASEEARVELERSIDNLIEVGRVAEALLRSLRDGETYGDS